MNADLGGQQHDKTTHASALGTERLELTEPTHRLPVSRHRLRPSPPTKRNRSSHHSPTVELNTGVDRAGVEESGSIASTQSWMAQQLHKAMKSRNQSAKEDVKAVRWSFTIIIVFILVLGIVGIIAQRIVGG